MPDHAPNRQVEDVLASIRRLVSDDRPHPGRALSEDRDALSAALAATRSSNDGPPESGRLVLTPALRVTDPDRAVERDDSTGDAEEAETADVDDFSFAETDAKGPSDTSAPHVLMPEHAVAPDFTDDLAEANATSAERRASSELSAKIAALEAVIGKRTDDWEPDDPPGPDTASISAWSAPAGEPADGQEDTSAGSDERAAPFRLEGHEAETDQEEPGPDAPRMVAPAATFALLPEARLDAVETAPDVDRVTEDVPTDAMTLESAPLETMPEEAETRERQASDAPEETHDAGMSADGAGDDDAVILSRLAAAGTVDDEEEETAADVAQTGASAASDADDLVAALLASKTRDADVAPVGDDAPEGDEDSGAETRADLNVVEDVSGGQDAEAEAVAAAQSVETTGLSGEVADPAASEAALAAEGVDAADQTLQPVFAPAPDADDKEDDASSADDAETGAEAQIDAVDAADTSAVDEEDKAPRGLSSEGAEDGSATTTGGTADDQDAGPDTVTMHEEDVSDGGGTSTLAPGLVPAGSTSATAQEDAFGAKSAQAASDVDDIEGVSGRGVRELDDAALRELVAEIVREELQGPLGERITRNVRKLVRREIHRALAAQNSDLT